MTRKRIVNEGAEFTRQLLMCIHLYRLNYDYPLLETSFLFHASIRVPLAGNP